jgi:hypothetical protein
LRWIALESRFCVFWIRKTIRKVMIVVPVLMTHCQTSEKWKIGPVSAQTTIIATAAMKAQADPVASETLLANLRNASVMACYPLAILDTAYILIPHP